MNNGYFAGDYFGGTVPGLAVAPAVAPTPGGPSPLTDARAIVWVRDSIDVLDRFAQVTLGVQSFTAIGPESFPFAVVYPIGFIEADQGDGSMVLRTLRYGVAIGVQAGRDDFLAALVELGELANLAADALSGSCPDDALPALTRIVNGRYQDPIATDDLKVTGTMTPGVSRMLLMGEIAWLVDGRAGRPVGGAR